MRYGCAALLMLISSAVAASAQGPVSRSGPTRMVDRRVDEPPDDSGRPTDVVRSEWRRQSRDR